MTRLPRWAVLLLGAVMAIAGIVLVTRPFASLGVLILLISIGCILSGLGDLAGGPSDDRRLRMLAGIAWIGVGAGILLWPGIGLRGLALVVGIALVVSGILRLAGALRDTEDQRLAAALLGLASVVLGLVALAWPDITLLVVAVVFGIRLMVFGLAHSWDALRGPDTRPAALPGRLRRWMRTTGAAVALLVACVVALLSVGLNEGVATPDAFYTGPSDVPDQPGQLLRSEPFTRVVPDSARMWRILYTTTRADGVPAVASALVAAPVEAPAGPRPLIAWSHGTTGVAESCAPSLLPTGIESGSPNAIDQVIAHGWVMVSTDYSGLGTAGPHAYLVGEQAGRSVLDAVRAAHQMPELELEDRTVVWGHSQGGAGALWTGVLASTYAPDTHVIGVAALSPASDLPALVGNLAAIPGGDIFASYVITGYSATYPDVRFTDYVRATAQLQVREIASRCLTSEALVSAIQTFLFDGSIWATDPSTGPAAQRLAENVPRGHIEAPLLVAQGDADPLVLPSAQAAFVEARCEAGEPVDYRTYAGEDHISVVEPDSPLIPELVAWTQDRLDGRPATPTCGT
jgi:uncharacterized membrane protein HdeD (DUF308 family)/alpha-beta hydrolase superfamily lysophospholipase